MNATLLAREGLECQPELMADDIRWQQRFSNNTRALAQLETFTDPLPLNEREQHGLIKAFK